MTETKAPHYLKCTVWTIETPDERNDLIGYRWTLENKKLFITSKEFFTTEERATKSAQHYATKFGFVLKTVHYDYRTNTEFLA